jgi:energy-coupling factor transport system ATP-binding protein
LIELKSFSLSYGSEDSQIFRRVNLEYQSAEFSVICGPTGSGKSTLLKSLIGLVPSFNFAHTSGEIFLDGIGVSGKRPQELANLIGFVNQRPEAAFVTESVIEEISFGMEQLGFPVAEMERRVKQISKQLEIDDLLESRIDQLSTGQQQRIAIAAALAAGQKLLLLDEPSAALDAEATTNLWKLLRDLADNHGVTVLVAEHRLAEVIDFADSVTLLKGDGSAIKLNPNWECVLKFFPDWKQNQHGKQSEENASRNPALLVTDLEVSYPGSSQPALNDISFSINQGEIVSLFGPNGSGKTTLIMAIAGVLKANRGRISLFDRDLPGLKRKERSAALAVIPQRASDLLFLGSVSKELAEADSYAAASPNTTSSIFEGLVGRVNPSIHPRDLSTGQQLALVIALQLSVGAELILLDEPTRGLDHEAKVALARQLGILASQGKSILIATHDRAFAQSVSHRTEVIEAGRIRKQGK